MSEAAPRKRGRPAGTTTVHRDRDRLLHEAVEQVMLHTALGLGRGESGPADLDACIVTTWIVSGGRLCAEYVCDIEQQQWKWVRLQAVALFLTESLEPHIAQAANRDVLIRQLRGADHITVRAAYQRIQAARPWWPSVREDLRRADRTRRVLAGEPITDARYMAGDDE